MDEWETYIIGATVVGEEFSPTITERGEVSVERSDTARIDVLSKTPVFRPIIAEVKFRVVKDGIFDPILEADQVLQEIGSSKIANYSSVSRKLAAHY
jgi:hypothetical protein